MFLFNGKPLSPDSAFTDPTTGIQYPANWLRLTSPTERSAIGIIEVPDPAPYDQRFYWGPGLPKDHGHLVTQWVDQTRTTANTLLAPTDWQVIREADNGKPMSIEIKENRQRIRELTSTKNAAITATTDTDVLAAYITSSAYSDWNPPATNIPINDVIFFNNNNISSAF